MTASKRESTVSKSERGGKRTESNAKINITGGEKGRRKGGGVSYFRGE